MSFSFYYCLALNEETRNALQVRDVADYGFISWEDQYFVFVPEIEGNEPEYSVGRFAAFLCLFWPLEVFGDDDSYIPLLICCLQLLIGHVMVALHVVVSDVHHITFIYIKTRLPPEKRSNFKLINLNYSEVSRRAILREYIGIIDISFFVSRSMDENCK